MDVETSENEKFLVEIVSQEGVAVAVYLDGEEKIFLPDRNYSSGTYYHETTDTLVQTANGYRLKLESEPESFEIID